MQAIKIDAVNCTVELIEIRNTHGLYDLQSAIGGGYLKMHRQLPNGDILYVDEQLQLSGGPQRHVEMGKNCSFIGNAVLVGLDDLGEFAPAKTNIENTRKLAAFFEVEVE